MATIYCVFHLCKLQIYKNHTPVSRLSSNIQITFTNLKIDVCLYYDPLVLMHGTAASIYFNQLSELLSKRGSICYFCSALLILN